LSSNLEIREGNGKTAPGGKVSMNLPSGPYKAIWIDPKTGQISKKGTFYSTKGSAIIGHPAFTEDVVLWIISTNLLTTPL
ncbi:MAG: hypothetical protein O7B35_03120, partial [Deltaproteobacteria bacterium]|nr:hypothetical protein [Deltaproteobacteria bacterium]